NALHLRRRLGRRRQRPRSLSPQTLARRRPTIGLRIRLQRLSHGYLHVPTGCEYACRTPGGTTLDGTYVRRGASPCRSQAPSGSPNPEQEPIYHVWVRLWKREQLRGHVCTIHFCLGFRRGFALGGRCAPPVTAGARARAGWRQPGPLCRRCACPIRAAVRFPRGRRGSAAKAGSRAATAARSCWQGTSARSRSSC
ncbi:MAG: hypothetical protein QOD83_4646, partial [Solirubrobacteraceae bacterium]|nr:hypothetical protein [Solirubrobacteraceae bacterium]